MSAEVKILVEGYTNADTKAESGEEENSCPTISLVRDGNLIMVVDPGVLDSQQILIDALEKEGLNINDVNMVCITHSHIDHYRNIGMFPNAKTLEFFGIWDKGVCEDWKEQFTPNMQVFKTPGHDYTGITLFVKTNDGIIAICGDIFWRENSPEQDHNSKSEKDEEELIQSRKLVLEMADWIVPGHAGMYKAEKGSEETLKKSIIGPKINKIKSIAVCKKCGMPNQDKKNICICRPWLCYRCCECETDCDTCNCSHRNK